MPNQETKIRERVEAEFRFLEDVLSSSNPGIVDLLQVYGGYDAALKQADEYLAVLDPQQPLFFTTDRST